MSNDLESTSSSVEGKEDNESAAISTRGGPQRRGAGFPRLSLSEAARILKEAGKYGFEHTASAFAEYMGLSTTNSGSFRQRLAAFRDFKLIAGRGEVLTMTGVARQIAQPLSEAGELEALQEAFANCQIFADLYEKSSKGVSLQRRHLAARAIHEFRVSPANGDAFVDSFAESLAAAGLGEEDGEDVVILREKVGRPVDNANGETQSENESLTGTSGRMQQPASTPAFPEERDSKSRILPKPVIDHTWQIQGGQVVFQVCMEGAPASDAYSNIGTVIASIEELVNVLGPDQPIGQVDEPENGTDRPEE